MKRHLLSALFVGLFALLQSISLVAWAEANQSTSNGPDGVTITALAIDPANPSTLYAGAENGRVFKSTDVGGSWSLANTGLNFGEFKVNFVAIDPDNPATLYAGTGINDFVGESSGGLFKSTDGGESWGPANTGLPATSFNALAIDPDNSATLYVGTGRGVFKSTNGGGSWSPANTGLPAIDIIGLPNTIIYPNIYPLTIDPANPSTLYAGTPLDGVYKSTDGGGNWSPASTGLESFGISALAINSDNPATLYAGVNGGVYKSTDGGESWSLVNVDLTALSIRALVIDPDDPATLYAGTAGDGGGVQEHRWRKKLDPGQHRPAFYSYIYPGHRSG